MKPETFGTAGGRVSRSGFRVAVLPVVGGGGGGSSSVMEECQVVSLGQGIPSHASRAKRGEKGGNV